MPSSTLWQSQAVFCIKYLFQWGGFIGVQGLQGPRWAEIAPQDEITANKELDSCAFMWWAYMRLKRHLTPTV